MAALSVGIVGVGTVSSALARGMARFLNRAPEVSSLALHLGPRNAAKAQALADECKSLQNVVATQYATNAEVVQNSDIVMVAVLPKQAEEVMKELNFDGKIVVSTMAGVNKPELTKYLAHTRPERMISICPLPSCAHGEGTVMYWNISDEGETPATELFRAGLGCSGTVIVAKDEQEMKRLWVPCALMGPLYGALREVERYLANNGVEAENASKLTRSVARSFMVDTKEKSFDELIHEQTAGGYNEGALRHMEGNGGMAAWQDVMKHLYGRFGIQE